jgi:KaiC/GvpD/RAD55 family RecA-like ATPase
MSKWMTELFKKDYANKRNYNPFSNVLRSGSPSLDYVYANTHGLPFGYSEVLWGPPGGGKTLVTNQKIAQLHKDDPEAIAVKFDTEQRDEMQLTEKQMMRLGIDPERYVSYGTNRPDEIFDFIATDLEAMVQKGMPLRYLIIDSTSDIVGRRTLNADSVMQQQIGDEAKTIQDGLKLIKNTLRRYRIACSLVAQARAELDPVEQMRGNKLKMHAAWALQHFAEYFVYIEQNKTKEGKTDLTGKEFTDETHTDVKGNAERVAHKIRVVMKKSSCGPAGRVGEFTYDYYNGVKNIHEEAFLLGVGQGIVLRPNNMTYVVPDFPTKGQQFSIKGKDNFVYALKENTPMCTEILRRVRVLDIEAMENGRVAESGVVETAEQAAATSLSDSPMVD